MLTEIRKPLISNIRETLFSDKGLQLHLLRLDELHPEINGNKWYKLKYNLEAFHRSGKKILVSCGGAWSNHIAAMAAAGHASGIPTGAMIRGEEHIPLNPTLALASARGMLLYYADRALYRDKALLEQKAREVFGPDIFWIPEGGSNAWGVMGCTEILAHVKEEADIICCAAGTGATAAGIASSGMGRNKMMVFPALKGASFLVDEIARFAGPEIASEISLVNDYHFGGYGKTTPDLIRFVDDFRLKQGISLDYIYTGKMMFGLYDMASRGCFEPGTRILAVHTGGIQGNLGITINRDMLEIDS
ncbi:MAG: 1-aminocyclopropane-1-carboxylate deaminase/D-cysteine desulfhydrase [Bacteroidia bacterium]